LCVFIINYILFAATVQCRSFFSNQVLYGVDQWSGFPSSGILFFFFLLFNGHFLYHLISRGGITVHILYGSDSLFNKIIINPSYSDVQKIDFICVEAYDNYIYLNMRKEKNNNQRWIIQVKTGKMDKELFVL